MTEPEDHIAKLRAHIAKLTGRLPVSRNASYLTRKLDELREQKKNGETVKRHHAEPSVVMSISMPHPAKEAVARIADKERIGVSDLVRRALGEWAESHGYDAEVEHLLLGDD